MDRSDGTSDGSERWTEPMGRPMGQPKAIRWVSTLGRCRAASSRSSRRHLSPAGRPSLGPRRRFGPRSSVHSSLAAASSRCPSWLRPAQRHAAMQRITAKLNESQCQGNESQCVSMQSGALGCWPWRWRKQGWGSKLDRGECSIVGMEQELGVADGRGAAICGGACRRTERRECGNAFPH
jgi:hypothetical protein